MRAKSIAEIAAVALWLATGSGASGAAPGSPAEASQAPRTIILFGANWCAPCRVEMRQLASLAAAAAPDRLVVAWIDRAPLDRPAAPGANVAFIPPGEAQRRFQALAGGNQGLPAAAMLDRQGRLCDFVRYPLVSDSIARMKASCAN